MSTKKKAESTHNKKLMRKESLFIFGFALPNLVLNICESITIKCSFSSLVPSTVSSFYSVVVVNIPIFLVHHHFRVPMVLLRYRLQCNQFSLRHLGILFVAVIAPRICVQRGIGGLFLSKWWMLCFLGWFVSTSLHLVGVGINNLLLATGKKLIGARFGWPLVSVVMCSACTKA